MITWNHDFIKQRTMLPMQQLDLHFALSNLSDWPNASGLNTLRQQQYISNIPEFVCQNQLAQTTDYYEQIIRKQNIIPTRPNSWHDLFNALVWLQFPFSKKCLNRQHVEDIEQYGVSPRTHRRNNLTHFDECGVILAYERSDKTTKLLNALQQHEWSKAFVELRDCWGQQLNSFMFGHANLEMLLKPFIGLTGKWLAIEVDSQFSSLAYQQQIQLVDELLAQKICETDCFAEKKPLHPLPILGIPGVWEANKAAEFYQNTDYFRPKR